MFTREADRGLQLLGRTLPGFEVSRNAKAFSIARAWRDIHRGLPDTPKQPVVADMIAARPCFRAQQVNCSETIHTFGQAR